jgi:hypothetical protein
MILSHVGKLTTKQKITVNHLCGWVTEYLAEINLSIQGGTPGFNICDL